MARSTQQDRLSSMVGIGGRGMPFPTTGVAVVATLLLTAVVLWTPQSSSTPNQATNGEVGAYDKDLVFVYSNVIAGIPYYHCKNGSSSHSTIDLVLLHGSRFTKEDWKASKILHKFCAHDGVRVTALDLPVFATHDDLMIVLDALQSSTLVQLPISGLVTPSASGTTVLDGILSGRVVSLQKHVRRWIPVAVNSALKYSTDQLVAIKGWPILAIYGDRDEPGRRSSQLLQIVAQETTTVVQLNGSHSCYLDVPDVFVTTVLKYVS